MEKTTLSVEFPEYKLKAIQQALLDRNDKRDIPQILSEHLDGLYENRFPYRRAGIWTPNSAGCRPLPRNPKRPVGASSGRKEKICQTPSV